MKKKLKKLLIIAFILLLIILLYFIFKAFTVEKQTIDLKYTSKVNADSNLEAIVKVLDQNNNTKKSKLTLELQKNEKWNKRTGVKEKYKLNEGDIANCSLHIPSNIEAGKYNLNVKARSGLIVTKKNVTINVVNSNNSDIVISLDKGIYKPGDTIKYRALIVSQIDTTPKELENIKVEIFDGNGNKVYSNESASTEYGIVSGEFELASEVNSGTYKITVDANSQTMSKNFTVNPYVTPQFEVSITPDKEVYQVGDKANITLNARYFFGEPVANATVKGSIGKTEISEITDNDGNVTIETDMDSKGETEISISVTDTSNYLIEANKVIYAQEYPFEVETIFENGKLHKNMDNTVYLFAKKIDGTPVKIKANVNIGGIQRQVITDENGLGTFELNSYDTDRLGSNENYSISATDNEGNSYSNTENIEIVSNSIALTTDKVKYNQGEDITIKLSAMTDVLTRNIYVCKNNQIIKVISSNNNSEVINLEDVTGLVDIFVEGVKDYSKDYNYSIYYPNDTTNLDFIKKTIFIKPSKALNIGIETDKNEYQPGDKLNISFDITNEDNNKVNANVLVSILDEAVLSLANNDLSMDNIRLALQDIKLSDDISTEDLYAEIMDNKSETKLMLALLKKDASAPSIEQDDYQDEYSDEYISRSIITVAVMIFIMLIYLSLSDSKKFKNIIKDLITILVITILIFCLISEGIVYEYEIFNDSFVAVFISIALIVIIVYYLVLYKIIDTILELIFDLILIPLIYIMLFGVLYELTQYDFIMIIALFFCPVIMTILIVINRKNKLNKLWTKIKELFIRMTKIEIAYLLTYILVSMTFDTPIAFTICVIIIYKIINYIYKTKILNKTFMSKQLTVKLNIGELIITGFFIFIGILIIAICSYYYNSSSSAINSASTKEYIGDSTDIDFTTEDSASRKLTLDTYSQSGSAFVSTSKANSSKQNNREKNDLLDTLNAVTDVFNKDNNSKVKRELSNDINETESTNELNNTSEEKIEKVRNVFLESLAFIPDLIIENGKGSTQIPLSDNITTWNIQAIANTKEGNIGSNSKTFKVFKDFFVDFSLPTNSIVTDFTNIPVTIYNYKNTTLDISLNVVNNDWCTIGDYEKNVTLEPQSTKLVYIPIEIKKAGDNVLRVEARANGVSDIVERKATISPNGYKRSKVILSGVLDKSFSTDYFSEEAAVKDTRSLKVKIYPTAISQAIEGMDSIFKTPTGCFEQTSSSLYPNILALKFLEDNNLDDEGIKAKALEYISKGYQRLLTFEVKGEKGGYSLYGGSPAEPVITAFGLMELKDATEVYDIDKNVIDNMKDYLYKVQKSNGSFDFGSTYIGDATSTSDLAMNAYIIWALSEADPNDSRIKKSVSYLENKMDSVSDNYTLALMANTFINVDSKKANSTINKLMENVKETNTASYVEANVRDYYGSSGKYQSIQTTALTSMALSKNNSHATTNNNFIKFLISQKDSFGNWGTTQSTVLALKAINMSSMKNKIAGQTIAVSVDGNTKDIKIGNNPLDVYEVKFDSVKDEGKVSIDLKKGSVAYELIEEYYTPYENIGKKENTNGIDVTANINSSVRVNDIIKQEILIQNRTNIAIANCLVEITIPQGCTVDQNFLEKCKTLNLIEKYEYNYNKLNLYVRNLDSRNGGIKSLEVQYRANYPEIVTGGTIRAFDYYNPTIEDIEPPVQITVSE